MSPNKMLDRMIQIATHAHAGQLDKAGMPYILHCLKVMHYLKSDDLELMCIAVGHDLFEDTNVTQEDLLEEGFSMRVVTGIGCMTKWKGLTPQDYLKQVKSNMDSVKVKLADLRHNSDIRRLKGLTGKDFERMQRYHTMYVELEQYLRNE